jgi:hypothetical protein
MIPDTTPVFAVDEENLVPVSGHLRQMIDIPPSRMFLINKSLKVYREKNPGSPTYDASQGDGGSSLPGAPREILERAAQLQVEHGTAYDMPFGTDAYRKTVIEQYWKLDSSTGWGPANVLGTAGGRDALVKAYQAMMALGHGRQGDLIMVSRRALANAIARAAEIVAIKDEEAGVLEEDRGDVLGAQQHPRYVIHRPHLRVPEPPVETRDAEQ